MALSDPTSPSPSPTDVVGSLDVDAIRADFPIFERRIHDHPGDRRAQRALAEIGAGLVELDLLAPLLRLELDQTPRGRQGLQPLLEQFLARDRGRRACDRLRHPLKFGHDLEARPRGGEFGLVFEDNRSAPEFQLLSGALEFHQGLALTHPLPRFDQYALDDPRHRNAQLYVGHLVHQTHVTLTKYDCYVQHDLFQK